MEQRSLDMLRRWFTGYVRTFDAPGGEERRNYGMKEEHTFRVEGNALAVARELGLGSGEAALAGAVGLLHDVGRFPQYRRYRTFRDSASVNHAALGAAVLRREGALAGLPKEEQDLIVRVVALHNVFRLPERLEARLDLHARIVRDADKLDIWRIFGEILALPAAERPSAAGLGLAETPGHSALVLERLRTRQMVRLDQLGNLNDFKLLQLAWVYDLNFAPSLRMLTERDIIGALARTLPRDDAVLRAVDAVRTYVEQRLGG